MTIYTPQELSNEEYHALPQVSGSELVKIFQTCPAKYRYAERKETKALAEGTIHHCAILEPGRFAEQYERGLVIDDYPGALTTGKAIESALKERGIKGYSGLNKDDLISFALDRCPDLVIWDKIVADHAASTEKQVIDAALYDRAFAMRDGIDPSAQFWLANIYGRFEYSIVGKEKKVRPDCFINTADGIILIDYKTCVSAEPEQFGAAAHKYGYWLKMAYQRDVIEEELKIPVVGVYLLAQEKEAPYISMFYKMTEQQLQVGREQYSAALEMYKEAKEKDHWPKYASGVLPLMTPAWLEREYGFNEIDGLEVDE